MPPALANSSIKMTDFHHEAYYFTFDDGKGDKSDVKILSIKFSFS